MTCDLAILGSYVVIQKSAASSGDPVFLIAEVDVGFGEAKLCDFLAFASHCVRIYFPDKAPPEKSTWIASSNSLYRNTPGIEYDWDYAVDGIAPADYYPSYASQGVGNDGNGYLQVFVVDSE